MAQVKQKVEKLKFQLKLKKAVSLMGFREIAWLEELLTERKNKLIKKGGKR